MSTAETYLVVALAIAVLTVIGLVGIGRADADEADRLAADRDRALRDRDEARAEARELRRQEAPLRAELAVLRRHARQRATASAALTPDAEPPLPRWGLQTLRDIHLAASAADFDTPGSTR